nr:MAG TPA: hypothetical protein [Bacteriophage sp.]
MPPWWHCSLGVLCQLLGIRSTTSHTGDGIATALKLLITSNPRN